MDGSVDLVLLQNKEDEIWYWFLWSGISDVESIGFHPLNASLLIINLFAEKKNTNDKFYIFC